MATYRSNLESIRHLRVAARQAQQRRVADALRAGDALDEQAAAIQVEVEVAKSFHRDLRSGAIDARRILEVERYEQSLQAQKNNLQQQIALVASELERRRADLAVAEQQVRVIDKLDERRRKAFERQQRLKEQREQDEVATIQHLRQQR